jgi:hypothetical protein
MTTAIQSHAWVVEVKPVQRRREVVGVAFAPDFAVGHDVQAGVHLCLDGEQGGVILCPRKVFRGRSPQLARADPRGKSAGKPATVDQPLRLREASNERRWEERKVRHNPHH